MSTMVPSKSRNRAQEGWRISASVMRPDPSKARSPSPDLPTAGPRRTLPTVRRGISEDWDNAAMFSRRLSTLLARFVLAWFVLHVGAGVAAPLVSGQALQV